MGKRGPAPDPTALKLLKGGRRITHRPINENEPDFEGDPIFNEKVKADIDALRIWQAEAPELTEKGVLTFLDSGAFSQYCLLRAARDRLWDEIVTVGIKKATRNGLLKSFLTTDIRVERWTAKFGLTPSDRSMIKAKPRKGKEEKTVASYLK